MERKDLLKYIYKNYKTIDVKKEYDLVERFTKIFINNELYKRANEKQIDAFVTLYAKLKMIEKEFDYKVTTTGPKDSKKKFKVLKYIDTYDKRVAGTCDSRKVNIKLTNYLVKSLYKNKKELFSKLINTIHHELKHAQNYTESNVKYDILNPFNYYQMKFELLLKEARNYYKYYYNDFEEEIGAYVEGNLSVAELYKFRDKELSKQYLNTARTWQGYRYSRLYDEANIDAFDSVMLIDDVRRSKEYYKNKKYLQIEYDEKGKRRNIKEIIDAKYDQLNRLNYAIIKNPDDPYLIDILLNNKTEELFYEMGYISIFKDPDFTDYVTDENKWEVLDIIDYGINKTKKRIEENKLITPNLIDKAENYEYLKSRIQVLEYKRNKLLNKAKIKRY